MMQVYDVAVIGSGPAGYSALVALQGFSGSVAMIAGAKSTKHGSRHPKVVSVAFERGGTPNMSDRVSLADGSGDLFAAAEIGGFANYWGQQLQRYEPQEPWGESPELPTWRDYVAACEVVEAGFKVAGGQSLSSLANVREGFEFSTPRLLTGTAMDPSAGLGAMSKAVGERLAEMPSVDLYPERVMRVETVPNALRMVLDDGREIRARRVYLAAGVLGDSSLIHRSLPGTGQTRFRDHAPHMLLTLGLRRALGPTMDVAADHLNAITIKRHHEQRTDLFASVYSLSKAPFSLLTTMAGLGPRLRGRRAMKVVDLLRPIQLWTPATVVECCHLVDPDRIEAGEDPDAKTDATLQELCAWFKECGVRFRLQGTAPGHGFHYHSLEMGASRRPVDDALDEAFGGRLVCIDSSILARIGCAPHTLTSMARAYARVRWDLSRAN